MSGFQDNDEQVRDQDSGADSAQSVDEAHDLRHKLIRTQADFDNYRRRTQRDIEDARRRERSRVLSSMLEILDNFDRALSAQGAERNEWLDGLEGIRQQMLDAFRRFGATPFDASGENFDALRHECIATVPNADREDGAILDVIQTGFAFEDGTILRPAKVIVVRNS